MTSPIDIRPDHLTMVQDILRAHLPDGAQAWVFGSRATWTTKDSSDLDLAVQANGKIAPRVMGELEDAFRESDLPYTVDVIDLAAVDGQFKQIVESQKVSLPLGLDGADGQSEWKRLPFSEAVLVNPRVHLERGAEYPYVDMASVDPKSRDIEVSKRRKYSGGGSRFQSGDTLMARITPCLENGKIARYQSPNTSEKAHGSTEFIVIRGRPDVTDTDFAYYLTWWEEVRNYAIGHMTGTSGRQRVPADCLDDLVVPIPPLAQQRRIARILGTLDDKIDLNRRMNETLEEMARALFTSWFVHYDPVRAKIDGRWRRGESLPGLPADMYDMFPARMVESELGEIPEGWEVRALGEVGKVITGKTPSTRIPRYYGNDVPFLKIPDMHGKMYVVETGTMLSNEGACSQPRQALSVGSVSVSCIATPGLVVLNHRETHTNQQINSIIPHAKFISKYLYWSCRQLATEIMIAGSGGSVFVNLNKTSFSALPILYPKDEVMLAFEDWVSPLHDRILLNEEQSRTLGQIRDTLLPRLVSGEVQVGGRL